jgi:hypothetical protein
VILEWVKIIKKGLQGYESGTKFLTTHMHIIYFYFCDENVRATVPKSFVFHSLAMEKGLKWATL